MTPTDSLDKQAVTPMFTNDATGIQHELDFHVKTNKAVSLRAHTDSTRHRVQPSACEDRGTPAASD
jgi:hypothetical protein